VTPWVRVTLAGIVALMAFDALASIATRLTGVPYTSWIIGSWLLYGATGYAAARAVPHAPVQAAAMAGLALGLADATAGWAISWALGPGRVPEGLTVMRWARTAVLVAAMAAGVAAFGGVLGRPRADSERVRS